MAKFDLSPNTTKEYSTTMLLGLSRNKNRDLKGLGPPRYS